MSPRRQDPLPEERKQMLLAGVPSGKSGDVRKPPFTEKEFQGQVLGLARLLGWRAYHTWTSIRSSAGFPDLVLVRGDRLIFAELKGVRGKLTGAQMEWLSDLKNATDEVYVWRPDDFPEVRRILR